MNVKLVAFAPRVISVARFSRMRDKPLKFQREIFASPATRSICGHEGCGRVDVRKAKFRIGEVVRHRFFPFRGVVFDADPNFDSDEEWWQAIPEDIRPDRDQPFYHLFAENEFGFYRAYVSEENLVNDAEGGPVNHPKIAQHFEVYDNGLYSARNVRAN